MVSSTPALGDHFLFKVDNGSFSTTVPPAFATDHSADGLHTISVEEVDTAGNISAPENFHFTLDTIAPEITAVTAAPSNGVEGVGETVAIKVAFGEAVAVTGGTPTLSLNDHGTATYDAAATAALHDPTKLVFDYTVGVSDTITSPLAVTGINLHGAVIGDLAGNAANLSNVATTFTGLGIDSSLITANPDSNRVVAGQSVSADAAHGVLANDTDSNAADHLVVGAVAGMSAGVNQPVAGAYGSLTMHADGSYAYSAGGAVAGVAFDTFTYTAGNGHQYAVDVDTDRRGGRRQPEFCVRALARRRGRDRGGFRGCRRRGRSARGLPAAGEGRCRRPATDLDRVRISAATSDMAGTTVQRTFRPPRPIQP